MNYEDIPVKTVTVQLDYEVKEVIKLHEDYGLNIHDPDPKCMMELWAYLSVHPELMHFPLLEQLVESPPPSNLMFWYMQFERYAELRQVFVTA